MNDNLNNVIVFQIPDCSFLKLRTSWEIFKASSSCNERNTYRLKIVNVNNTLIWKNMALNAWFHIFCGNLSQGAEGYSINNPFIDDFHSDILKL